MSELIGAERGERAPGERVGASQWLPAQALGHAMLAELRVGGSRRSRVRAAIPRVFWNHVKSLGRRTLVSSGGGGLRCRRVNAEG